MSEPVVLSASSINTYLRCQQQWYFAYVANIKSPPNVAMTIGLSAHKAVETNMEQKIASRMDLPVADVLDVFSSEYDTTIADVEDPDEDVGKAKDSGIDIVRLYHTSIAPPIQPTLVEEQIQFKINDVPYSTVLDLVEVRQDPVFGEDHYVLRELKTTKSTPTIDKYALQMTGQSIGLRHKTGQDQADVIVDALVRTKTPKHVQLRGLNLGSGEAVNQFAGIVGQVNAQIQTGNFIPNGLTNRACSWCGYTNICPAYAYFGK